MYIDLDDGVRTDKITFWNGISSSAKQYRKLVEKTKFVQTKTRAKTWYVNLAEARSSPSSCVEVGSCAFRKVKKTFKHSPTMREEQNIKLIPSSNLKVSEALTDITKCDIEKTSPNIIVA